jgi:hypothetical protein
MVASSGVFLCLVITAALYRVCLQHEFEMLTVVIISIASFLMIWWVTKSMVPLAHEGIIGKAFLIFWLVITGAYVAALDPLAALFFSIFTALVVWSCAVKMMTLKTE